MPIPDGTGIMGVPRIVSVLQIGGSAQSLDLRPGVGSDEVIKHDQLKSRDIDPARFFERILSQVEDYISVWDRRQQFIYVNQRLEDLWPFSPEEYFGKTPSDLGFSKEGAVLFERNVAKVLKTEEAVYGTFPYTPPFGSLRDYGFCFAPVFDEDGDVEFVVGFTRDITELNEAQKELERIRK